MDITKGNHSSAKSAMELSTSPTIEPIINTNQSINQSTREPADMHVLGTFSDELSMSI